jgi:glutathione peroxidase
MTKTIYDYKANDLSGKEIDLAAYKGKVLLIVNIASKCGFTPQLGGLEEIYEKYKDRGFEVIGFPSNQFAGQEPLEKDQISEFCQVNFGVSFKITER